MGTIIKQLSQSYHMRSLILNPHRLLLAQVQAHRRQILILAQHHQLRTLCRKYRCHPFLAPHCHLVQACP